MDPYREWIRTRNLRVARKMPEVLVPTSERPSSSLLKINIEEIEKEQQKPPAKLSPKDEFGAEFTFHPRVSTASSKIVENLGMDFLARQERHVERQKKLHEESKSLYNSNYHAQSESKRPKITNSHVRPSSTFSAYGDRNLLKKRSRMPKNNIRKNNTQEDMDVDGTTRSPLQARRSSSPPSLPPRSKTLYPMPHTSSSGNYNSFTARKRNSSDPYANFDRLQKAKLIAEKAIKFKKIFSIHGPYPLIRKALRERGWVEKEFKLPVRAKNNNKSNDSDDDADYDDDDDDDSGQKDSGIGMSPRPPFETEEENEPNDCYGIMGRMVRNETAMFQWTTRTASVDWKFLHKDQIVNHFSKANFTTKVGLCMNLRMLSCFGEGHSDTFFPRCYRLSNEEDKLDFIDDFRLTAASGILKIAVARHSYDSYGRETEKFENGQLPPPGGTHVIPTEILLLAIGVCESRIKEREHEDIDTDERFFATPDDSWEQLILHYSKLVHEGAVIAHSGSYFKRCEEVLTSLKESNPQHVIEGVKNTWIIKPGAKSRGRGILVLNKLDEILKLVSGDSTLIKDSRWVVQKYIERPLLIYSTKFDIRQWFLVSDWNPLTVWIYKDSYLRFSSKPFTLKNLDAAIHLCNYSVQKNIESDQNRHPLLPPSNMWSSDEFQDYLKQRGCQSLWGDLIMPGMKKAIQHICYTAQDTVEYRKGSFELYGADFMIDENYNPWLIEVNSSPTMSRATPVTSKLCSSVQEDTMKVILDRKKDKNCDVGLFEIIFKQPTVDVPLYVGKALNVEGFTIKKPNNQRRSFNSNPTQSHSSGDNTVTASSKITSKAASIYGQSGSNRPAKITIRNSMTSKQGSERYSHAGNYSSKAREERVCSPVKMKMSSTLKRLTSEAHNTPQRPNAFNLPKCSPSNTSTGSTGSSSVSSVNSQTSVMRMHGLSKGPTYTIKLPGDPQSATNSGHVHFVSSSQSKAASTMGIMNSPYCGLIAAANRGCLPGKLTHPHPPTQAIVPKTFPASGVPGGDVIAEGNPLQHPPPPPGVVAVTPQTIGLGLPFQKYFNVNANVDHLIGAQAANQRRRNYANTNMPDFRLTRPRVSGIYEWFSKQQENGFSVSCYYAPEEGRDVIADDVASASGDVGTLIVPEKNENAQNEPGFKEPLGGVRPPGKPRHRADGDQCPFGGKFRFGEVRKTKSAAVCVQSHSFKGCANKKRAAKSGHAGSYPARESPLPLMKLFSLKQRHMRSLRNKRKNFLTITVKA